MTTLSVNDRKILIQRTLASEYSRHCSGSKIQEFDLIQVLFKSSSIFQRFD